MNTQRTKTMIIVLLSVLNAVLFILLIIQSDKYRLSGRQEKAIRDLLSDNGIGLSADIMKSFDPTRALNMLPYSIDIAKEAERFFDDTQKTTQTESWERITAESDEGILSLAENILRFENAAGYKTEDFLRNGYSDPDATRRLCDDYIKKIRPDALDFEFDHIEEDENYSFYYYRGSYKDYMIYSNYIRLRVNDSGVIVASCRYGGIPSGFNNYAREIYAPDEALFSLMKHVKNIYSDAAVDISNMELVYYLDEVAIEASKAVPCYKFQLSVNGVDIWILVDGYTNSVVR